MAKLTLEQKRLETLRRQLQGKDPLARAEKGAITRTHQPERSNFKIDSTMSYTPQAAQISSPIASLQTGALYLKKDLLRILILASLAIGTLMILYLSPQGNMLIHLI